VSYSKSCRKSSPKNKIDLHVHTTASDGAYSPCEIVHLAQQKGIKYLAITDHDTTAGLAAAAEECRKYELEFIPGIEFSTIYEEYELHILGYNFKQKNERMQETIQLLQKARVSRIEKMVAKLAGLGIYIDMNEVRNKASAKNLGRVHLALVLIDKGVVNSIAEAFMKYLDPGCAAFIPRFKFTPCLAIEIIKEAKGIPVLAHPGLIDYDPIISLLAENGLQGLEVFHPRHSQEEEDKYGEIAQKYNLFITGGSDFHGHEEHDLTSFGEMKVPLNSIKLLHPEFCSRS